MSSKQPLTFDLRINFTGMCLFVPDSQTAADRGEMHVLMPRTGPDSTSPPTQNHRHVVRAVFDTAYLRPNQQQLDDIPMFIALETWAIEFPFPLNAGQTGTASTLLDPTIAHLDPFMTSKVKRNRITHNPGLQVASRVTLTRGEMGLPEPGALWRLTQNGHTKDNICMSFIVPWIISGIEAPDNRYPLTVLKLNANGSHAPRKELCILHPIDGEIRMEILNVPYEELPPHPQMMDCPPNQIPFKAEHFGGYSEIYDGQTVPIPEFQACDCLNRATPHNAAIGSLLTCMVASATVDP